MDTGHSKYINFIKKYLQIYWKYGIILPVRQRGWIMQAIATTKMSSKGQVVIPENIRDQMHLESGMQFVVIGENDVVILKSIETPSIDEFDSLISRARKQAKTAGMKKADITAATAKVRQSK